MEHTFLVFSLFQVLVVLFLGAESLHDSVGGRSGLFANECSSARRELEAIEKVFCSSCFGWVGVDYECLPLAFQAALHDDFHRVCLQLFGNQVETFAKGLDLCFRVEAFGIYALNV